MAPYKVPSNISTVVVLNSKLMHDIRLDSLFSLYIFKQLTRS